MDPRRKRMHDTIEQAARHRDEKSEWKLIRPKRPSQQDIAAAQPKPSPDLTSEVHYNLFDR